MTDMHRVKVLLSGAAVTGPGVATFYTITDPAAFVNALQTLYNTLKNFMPLATHINVSNSGETIDSNTGAFVGVWSGGSTSGLDGTNAGNYAQGVGGRIVWNTDGITHNRHVRGSTFIVPMSALYYSSDGTLDDTGRGNMQTAVNTFHTATAAGHVIWTRKRETTSGVEHSVTSATVSDKVTWLKSRRT